MRSSRFYDPSTWPRWIAPEHPYNLRAVAPRLYVGAEYAPMFNPSGLPWAGIVDFYGTSAEPERELWYAGAEVLALPFDDGDRFPPLVLDRTLDLVARMRPVGPVLLHCQAGLSRSASAAYGMLRRSLLPHDEALRRVKVCAEFPRSATLRSARRWAERMPWVR